MNKYYIVFSPRAKQRMEDIADYLYRVKDDVIEILTVFRENLP